MPTNLSSIDLATLNAAQGAIAAAIRQRCCQWEQESADAAADGRLSNALMLEHWAFAADLLTSAVSAEFSMLFTQALGAQMNWSNTTRSMNDQLLDAMTMEVASAQGEPLLPC